MHLDGLKKYIYYLYFNLTYILWKTARIVFFSQDDVSDRIYMMLYILLKDTLYVVLCVITSRSAYRGLDVTPITLALNGAAAYPRACQALLSMLSRNALNPADITVVRCNVQIYNRQISSRI